tara:strand:- start:3053 stop:3271 length:219 start_codon:yes stop_codon:yes gene_type:complete
MKTTNNLIPLSDIKWVYNLVHSKMFYKGLTLDQACEVVENSFDGSQPEGLFTAVKKYHYHKLEMNTKQQEQS